MAWEDWADYDPFLDDSDLEPPPLDNGYWTTKNGVREKLCYLSDGHILRIRDYLGKRVDHWDTSMDDTWWLAKKLEQVQKEIKRRKKHGRLFK